MKDLRIPTGVEEYRLNGKLTVHFNPTDVTFLERLRKTSERLSEWQDTLNEERERLDAETLRFYLEEMDCYIRRELDTLFDVPICEELFGDVNLCASADGFPVWANLINALTDTVEEAIRAELAAREKRIAKYTEKYAMDPKGEG